MATAVSAQREQPCLERVSAKRECAAVSVQREQPCLLYAMGGGSASAKREQSVHATGIESDLSDGHGCERAARTAVP